MGVVQNFAIAAGAFAVAIIMVLIGWRKLRPVWARVAALIVVVGLIATAAVGAYLSKTAAQAARSSYANELYEQSLSDMTALSSATEFCAQLERQVNEAIVTNPFVDAKALYTQLNKCRRSATDEAEANMKNHAFNKQTEGELARGASLEAGSKTTLVGSLATLALVLLNFGAAWAAAGARANNLPEE